jgi:uncharacterized damage-inducible protein DinB
MAATTLAPEIAILLRLLDESYKKKAWHGPNLRGSIRGVEFEEAAWRPAPGRHNIWENVVHAAYWKYAVARRLLGEKKGSFPVKGSNWFVRPVENSAEAWRKDVALLDTTHRALWSAVAALRPTHLHKIRPGSKFPALAMVTGIASHDVYHAGQIQLLKRLARAGASEPRHARSSSSGS